ncbi:MAG: arabinose-proton symporter AraE [Bacteroidales bacterium]
MNKYYTLRIALAVSLGGFLFGFDASVISGVIEFIKPQFGLDELRAGWVVSSPSFAAMFAMLASGTISDYIGRKKVLIWVGLLYSVSAIASALAPGWEVLVVARMIGGVAFGAALVLAPVYIAEIAPPAERGKLVSIQQFNIVLGFSVSYFTNYLLLNAMENGSSLLTRENIWRWMLGIETLPALVYFALMLMVPGSPRWLIMKNRKQKAAKILNKIYGADNGPRQLKELEANLQHSSSGRKLTLRTLFTKSLALVMTVALILGIVQQVTGINAVLFYAPAIFKQSGVGTNAAFAQAVLVGVIQVIFTVLAMLLIDKAGRKPLILAGLAGVVVSMAITSYAFSKANFTLTEESIENLPEEISRMNLHNLTGKTYYSDLEFRKVIKPAIGEKVFDRNEAALLEATININAILVLIGILLFIASFAVSLGPVMWVVLSEIFPNKIRGGAIALIGFINSLASFGVQLLFPWELSHLGNASTYALFGLTGLAGFILLAWLMPETKGKSLEQLEIDLMKE